MTHPDPTDYYRHLCGRPPHWSDTLDMWVAASSVDVRAVLSHPAAKVRPPGNPVPAHLTGTAAGDVFQRLVRMTDGDHHQRTKSAIGVVFDAIGRGALEPVCELAAADVHQAVGVQPPCVVVERWTDAFPVAVIGRLSGFDRFAVDELVTAARGLARCFAPGADESTVRDAADAADVLSRAARGAAGGLAAILRSALAPTAYTDVEANVAGWFFQTFDATAGLIGNAALQLRAGSGGASDHSVERAREVVARALRVDPPVHNTRRFVHADVNVAGQTLPAGDPVLLVLAAANLDDRTCMVPFGWGPHRCPASSLAPEIAAQAITHLLPIVGDELPLRRAGFRPSFNVRIPRFAT